MDRVVKNTVYLENQRVWTKIIAGCGYGFSVIAALSYIGVIKWH